MPTSPAPAVVVHIGAHKTGTTAFQHFMHINRPLLAERGIAYPRCHPHREAQYRIAWALRGMTDITVGDVPDFARELLILREAIGRRPCSTVVISCEEFFVLGADKIAMLREALYGSAIRIVAVVRRPDEFFASMYNQRVKPIRGPFATAYEALLADPVRLSADLDYAAALDRWASVFGDAAMTVLTYEGGDIVERLCRTIGIAAGDGYRLDGRMRNERISVRLAEAIRIGKTLGLERPLMEEIRSLGAVLLPAGDADSLLRPEDRIAILRHFDAMTDAVFARYLGGDNSYRSDRFRPADFPARTELAADDWRRLLAAAEARLAATASA